VIRPVVVLTNKRDLAADDIIRRIDAAGYPVHRLNADSVVEESAWSWRPDQSPSHETGAVWWRQFELPAEGELSLSDADDLFVVRAQWRAWLSTLRTSNTVWVNDLWSARKAENKVEQLRAARSVGFEVPPSLITNDPVEAARFGDHYTAIVKSLAGAYYEISGLGFVYTQELDDHILQDRASWYRQPLIVQQRLAGANVRVVTIGQHCFGALCETDALDWRTAGIDAVWRAWDVPDQLARLCRSYMRVMDLRYAAFDFMSNDDGTWFLEANQAGEWTFLDRTLDLGIAATLAAYLQNVARGRP
jgi:glutathione synthase/RimK-type ligase-like ATP-grasp enzyme